MAMPTTRDQFKEYCLRKLGKPVIEINVADEQVEDRIDEAISYYHDYHFDGTEKTFLKHIVTQEDIDNGYLPIPENIIGVVNIFDIGDYTTSSNMFSLRYQMSLAMVHNMATFQVQDFYMRIQHMQFLEQILVGKQPIRYNRHVNKLHIDVDWNRISVDDVIVAECYQILDATLYTDMWKDRWLQNYASAKIKYQWGSNLTKFENMQLPGGVMFNGQQILQDARDEIMQLEDEMISGYSLPVHDMIG